MTAPRAAVGQTLRIIALPLTSNASSSGRHIYYHFQTPSRASLEKDGTEPAKPSLLKRATEKASETWAGFGKAPSGSWKQKLFTYGERVVDRIDFQELALKYMDPSLGPKITKFGAPDVQFDEKAAPPRIPLLHPSHLGPPLDHLDHLLARRIPAHRKGFYLWMALSPLTAPFMIIPIVPNIPFFFCVWRSWHHYKAYKASTYLASLLHRGAIHPASDPGLDRIYAEAALRRRTPPPPPPSSSGADPAAEAEEHLILDRAAVPALVAHLRLASSTAESDLYRALSQTANRLSSGR